MPLSVAALATDLGCNGIDIDWEDGIGKVSTCNASLHVISRSPKS